MFEQASPETVRGGCIIFVEDEDLGELTKRLMGATCTQQGSKNQPGFNLMLRILENAVSSATIGPTACREDRRAPKSKRTPGKKLGTLESLNPLRRYKVIKTRDWKKTVGDLNRKRLESATLVSKPVPNLTFNPFELGMSSVGG